MPRSPIPPKVRWQVLARDGFRCRYCGAHAGDAVLVVDHSHPVSRGGLNNPDNLITSCETCNQGKGAAVHMAISEFRDRHDALDCVCGWLERLWSEESQAGWSPPEASFIHLLNQSSSYSEAERIVRSVAQRLANGAIQADSEPMYICDLIASLAEFLNVSRGHADYHHYDWTEELQERDWAFFWTDKHNTFGLMTEYPGRPA